MNLYLLSALALSPVQIGIKFQNHLLLTDTEPLPPLE
jgi:hypothetical protein